MNSVQARASQLQIDLDKLPQHIAIIMDGNGRWANRKGLGRLLGHREGYRNLREVLLNCSELGIRYLTVYAFSAENWRRPEEEVKGLFALIERAARDELRVMHRNGVRVRVAGRINELPSGLRQALLEGIETTQGNEGITFTLAVNYGGRAEIVDAVRKIIAHPPNEVTEETVSAALYNPDHPDPDLMIRTAGELRLSNFLLWQSAYSELYISPAPWPEFSLDELLGAIASYQRRTRKFGGLV
jgi:undecaprenyl diphosphate synthase